MIYNNRMIYGYPKSLLFKYNNIKGTPTRDKNCSKKLFKNFNNTINSIKFKKQSNTILSLKLSKNTIKLNEKIAIEAKNVQETKFTQSLPKIKSAALQTTL